MKLTSKGRFAVTSLVDMAINSTGNRPISLSEISRRQNISINFLEQIFSSLKKKGIVKSIRGPLGGYIFAKDPSFIMIYDVINATDEELKITRCKGIETSCLSTKKKSKCLFRKSPREKNYPPRAGSKSGPGPPGPGPWAWAHGALLAHEAPIGNSR